MCITDMLLTELVESNDLLSIFYMIAQDKINWKVITRFTNFDNDMLKCFLLVHSKELQICIQTVPFFLRMSQYYEKGWWNIEFVALNQTVVNHLIQ